LIGEKEGEVGSNSHLGKWTKNWMMDTSIGGSEGEPRGALPPWTLVLPPLWTFETMVSATTGWKLFSVFIKKGHITEDYLFIYALCIFKLYTV